MLFITSYARARQIPFPPFSSRSLFHHSTAKLATPKSTNPKTLILLLCTAAAPVNSAGGPVLVLLGITPPVPVTNVVVVVAGCYVSLPLSECAKQKEGRGRKGGSLPMSVVDDAVTVEVRFCISLSNDEM
jgi:hypothetical protein